MTHRPQPQADGHPGTTLERVAAIIDGVGDTQAAIHDETLFAADLGIDALAFALVAAAVEQDFGVDLPDGRALQMRSVGDLVSWLDAQRPADCITS